MAIEVACELCKVIFEVDFYTENLKRILETHQNKMPGSAEIEIKWRMTQPPIPRAISALSAQTTIRVLG